MRSLHIAFCKAFGILVFMNMQKKSFIVMHKAYLDLSSIFGCFAKPLCMVYISQHDKHATYINPSLKLPGSENYGTPSHPGRKWKLRTSYMRVWSARLNLISVNPHVNSLGPTKINDMFLLPSIFVSIYFLVYILACSFLFTM